VRLRNGTRPVLTMLHVPFGAKNVKVFPMSRYGASVLLFMKGMTRTFLTSLLNLWLRNDANTNADYILSNYWMIINRTVCEQSGSWPN
jgi:hypothetical protein